MDLITDYEMNEHFRAAAAMHRSRSTAFCVRCGTLVKLITPQETDEMYRANWVEMVRLTEEGSIHRIHNSQGSLQFCLNSMQTAESKNRKTKSITLKPLDFLC
ncbi:MAG: hypothetical protein H7070_05870 [Saprospiraceae bacterium]|nr:hypothetical protein [Pyrinomonadaceae bacterium]